MITVAPVSHEQHVPPLLPWLQVAVSAEVGNEFGEDLENRKRHPDTRVKGGWNKPWVLASCRKRTLDLQGKGKWGTADPPCPNVGDGGGGARLKNW